jgi:ABC-type proline/glycine betaine transport system permease subunit
MRAVKKWVVLILLVLESCLTTIPFVVSWMLSAVVLSVWAGILMARSKSEEEKARMLTTMWTLPPPADPSPPSK